MRENTNSGQHYPVFLSVVMVVNSYSDEIESVLQSATEVLENRVEDYELILIENGKSDLDDEKINKIVGVDGFYNVQIYRLTSMVSEDAAAWVGIKHSLGDYVAIIDYASDEFNLILEMLELAVSGSEVVFAKNKNQQKQSLLYSIGSSVFNKIWKVINNFDLDNEAPKFRLVSKNVINFIMRHNQPEVTHRYLPATAGFTKTNIDYDAPLKFPKTRVVRGSIDIGLRLIASSTRAPLRWVTSFSFLGAITNLGYSIYVILIAFLKADVAEGWVTSSLQNSGMFFCILLVLFVLSEYILNIASSLNSESSLDISKEFTSTKIGRMEKLNVESKNPEKAGESKLADGKI